MNHLFQYIKEIDDTDKAFVWIEGTKTYDIRHELNKLGGKWYADRKQWLMKRDVWNNWKRSKQFKQQKPPPLCNQRQTNDKADTKTYDPWELPFKHDSNWSRPRYLVRAWIHNHDESKKCYLYSHYIDITTPEPAIEAELMMHRNILAEWNLQMYCSIQINDGVILRGHYLEKKDWNYIKANWNFFLEDIENFVQPPKQAWVSLFVTKNCSWILQHATMLAHYWYGFAGTISMTQHKLTRFK